MLQWIKLDIIPHRVEAYRAQIEDYVERIKVIKKLIIIRSNNMPMNEQALTAWKQGQDAEQAGDY